MDKLKSYTRSKKVTKQESKIIWMDLMSQGRNSLRGKVENQRTGNNVTANKQFQDVRISVGNRVPNNKQLKRSL